MTGRDLIIYILANGLEDEPVFQDGNIVGLMKITEAARKMNVGVATIYAWIQQKKLTPIVIENTVYIPADSKSPIDNVTA